MKETRRSRLVWSGLAGLILTLAAGSGQAQKAPDPGRWTGCWDVEWGKWTPPLPEEDTLRYRPPPRVQLTDALSSSPRERSFHAQSAPGSLPTPHSVTWWRPISDDSLTVGWSSGFTGTTGRFAGPGDTLRGELRTFVDVKGRQRYRADAKLVRASCSEPPDVPASAAGRGLWFVPLERGDTIHLGRLLPEELIESAGDASYRIAGTPTGIFAGAREVRAQLTRGGTVASVRLRYPPDASLDSLVAVFRDTLGSPHTDDRRRLSRVLWLTSTTDLDLRRSGVAPAVSIDHRNSPDRTSEGFFHSRVCRGRSFSSRAISSSSA